MTRLRQMMLDELEDFKGRLACQLIEDKPLEVLGTVAARHSSRDWRVGLPSNE